MDATWASLLPLAVSYAYTSPFELPAHTTEPSVVVLKRHRSSKPPLGLQFGTCTPVLQLRDFWLWRTVLTSPLTFQTPGM